MGFEALFSTLMNNPIFLITVLLILGVTFVNGWTDAPNAIASLVTTRAMPVNKAILMSAIFNFLGVVVMSYVSPSVAFTIKSMVNFGGSDNSHSAIVALCAALVSIVVWAVGAWFFGIPTSESHALIAGITGAGIAIVGNASAINVNSILLVLLGLVLSLLIGFGLGFSFCRLVMFIFRKVERQKSIKFFKYAQIAGGATMSFMHGAQDGLKFLGVLMLAFSLSGVEMTPSPVWLMLVVSVIIFLGTAVGGKKIIKSVGMDMVKLEKFQGFSADIASSIGLFCCSLFGIPVSTTHMKTTAIMGAAGAKKMSSINLLVVKDMCLAWLLTFPCCGLLSFLVAKLFLFIF